MVKVKWLTRSATSTGIIQPGEVHEWDEKEALMLQKSGYVEILDPIKPPANTRKKAASPQEG